jgi:hypothetical protein
VNFNAYSPLSDTDIARFIPILLPTMAAAIHGAYEVVQYLKDVGVELKIPLELQPFGREVLASGLCHKTTDKVRDPRERIALA